MTLKKENYLYFKEIYSEAAANCYTGSVSKILKLYGKNILESDIWIAGKGFGFSAGIDDYGNPRLSFDLIKTVEVFCGKCGCTLNWEAVNPSNFELQLKDHLKTQSLIVWVNSKHLKYSDLYYSEAGYLHAIVLERMINKELVRIQDSLIVSTPAVSCVADFHIDDLKKSILDFLPTPELPVMGSFISLQIHNSELLNIDLHFKIRNLYSNTIEILSSYQNQESEIMKYCRKCNKELLNNDADVKIWHLRRINTIIKTLYVIPNRSLFYEIIPSLQLRKEDEKQLLQTLEELIKKWMILANYCLKCTVQSDVRGVNELYHYFSIVDEGEKQFWTIMESKLQKYL